MHLKKCACTVACLTLLSGSTLAGPMGTVITYQGKLASDGSSASGYYDLKFALFDAVAGGTQIGPTVISNAVTLADGCFAVPLDFGDSAFDGNARWLEIGVRTNGRSPFVLLNPRQPLAAAPYALYAKTSPGTPGPAGPPGLNWLGSWSVATAYKINDAVSYNGSSYVATHPTTGVNPAGAPAYWSLLAQQGAQGPAGAPGTLANNSVSSALLAADIDSLGKITGGLTEDSSHNFFLNDHTLFLRGDLNHGLGWYGTGHLFASDNVDGPVLYGFSGGALGTTSGSQALALRWDAAGNLAVDPTGLNGGTLTPGLTFGSGSGEGISSKRTAGGNQFGLDFYTSFTKRLTIANNGNVGINTTNPGARLQIVGTQYISATQDGVLNVGPLTSDPNGHYLTMDSDSIQAKTPTGFDPLWLNSHGGGVVIGSTGNGGTSYTLWVAGNAYSSGNWAGSDARWKKNVQPVTHALQKVTHLQGVTYDWRRDEFPARHFDEGAQLGFLAQDVEKIVPEAVRTDAEGYKAIAYEKLTAVLTEGVKEQQAEIESLKAQNAALDLRMKELNALVNKLLAK